MSGRRRRKGAEQPSAGRRPAARPAGHRGGNEEVGRCLERPSERTYRAGPAPRDGHQVGTRFENSRARLASARRWQRPAGGSRLPRCGSLPRARVVASRGPALLSLLLRCRCRRYSGLGPLPGRQVPTTSTPRRGRGRAVASATPGRSGRRGRRRCANRRGAAVDHRSRPRRARRQHGEHDDGTTSRPDVSAVSMWAIARWRTS